MEQLEQQLRSALADEAAALSVKSNVIVVADQFDRGRAVQPSTRKTRPVGTAIAAVVAVLLLVGVVPSLLRGMRNGDPVTETAPVTAIQTPPATTTAVASTTVPVVVPPPETSWERVVDATLQQGEIWAVASTDDVIVAVGDAYDPTEVSTLQGEATDAVVWVSTDGRSWERIDDEVVFGGAGAQILWTVASGPRGFIASGQDDADAALWFSPDGYQWEKVLVDDLGTPGEVDGLTVISSNPGWVAINDAAQGSGVFVSADGLHWSRIEDPAAIEDYVARFRSRRASQPVTQPSVNGVDWRFAWDSESVIAVGRHTVAAIWLSTDSGANWYRVDPEQPAFDGYPWPQTLDVTVYGSEIIVGGNAGGDAAIWIGTWDEA